MTSTLNNLTSLSQLQTFKKEERKRIYTYNITLQNGKKVKGIVKILYYFGSNMYVCEVYKGKEQLVFLSKTGSSKKGEFFKRVKNLLIITFGKEYKLNKKESEVQNLSLF